MLVTLIYSCESDDISVSAPTNISNVITEPRVGGAWLKWEIPADSNYTYIEVHYLKNGKEVVEKSSIYTDTLLIDGLINKEPTAFKLRTVNDLASAKAFSEYLETGEVTPIAREPKITFFPDDLTKLEVTADMLDTYTQETTEGPKENLVDGDPATYWHSAWSSNVAPLPHWIQVNFDEPQEMGAIKYWFRQNSSTAGRPQQWGLAVSEDGVNWTRVWESDPDLPITDNTKEYALDFGQNYTSKYFRVLILQDEAGTYANLGEISFYSMGSAVVDKEQEAEDEYYSF